MRVEEVIAEITQRCKNYGAKRIILFGSRAKDTVTERSDIDIAVAGVASCDIYELQEELEDIPTLYKIDLVDLDTCKNQLLLEDIKEYGREIQYYAITGFVTGSPRAVLKQSFRANLITGDEWIEMLKVKNQLAHDYDGVIVKEHCQTIIHEYIDKLYDFKTVVETLLKEDK